MVSTHTTSAHAALSAAWSLDGSAPAETIRRQGFALLAPDQLLALCGLARPDADALKPAWAHLPADRHLRDGGSYRFRRHASYVLDVTNRQLTLAPHRAHWQPTEYNALHGGIERWFEPVDAAVETASAWRALVAELGQLFADACATDRPLRWFVEAHQFRIDTASGIGRPTPEGAHRDGVDYVAVVLVDRSAVRGGETRVFQADAPFGVRFTMSDAWNALLLDDVRMIHETTPIQPAERAGWRDTLVLTYRRGGFLDAPPT